MRITTLILLFFTALLVSCNKHNITDSQSEIIGDYEWSYSLDSFYNTSAQDNHNDKWGIRIKPNSKVFVFKNQEEIFKGKITSVVSKSTNGWSIRVEHKDFVTGLTFIDNQLESSQWPFEEFTNMYQKK